jgi:hypothetical protein
VFTINGCATSQAEVAQTLNRLRLIDGVAEVTLQSSTKQTGASSSSVGGCPSADPAFTIQVSFHPLPPPSVAKAASITRAAYTGGGR